MATACGSSSKNSTSTTTGGGGSSASGAAGNKGSAPGITATTVKVALITSLTGADSSNSVNIPKGFAARIKAQNAAGGVDGRQIEYVTEDDTSTPSGAQTAAQVAANGNVFAVDYNSPFAFGAARYLTQQSIPVVGGGYDGPEWTQPSTYPNMFSWVPSVWQSNPVWTTDAQFIKDQGGTRIASLGYGVSPSSAATAKGIGAAAKAVGGVSAPYIDSSLPFGTVNVTAIGLAMKAANVDSLYGPIDPNTLLAVIGAAKQTGVNLKVSDLSTGYGQDFLDDPQGRQTLQGAYMISNSQVPVELKTPATLAEQAAFAKYENFTGVPDFGWTHGYASADLLIKGLEVAGQNPTRSSFISNLRHVTNYDVGGLAPAPAVNYSTVATPPSQRCSYYVQLEGNGFNTVNNGKPVCGTLVTGS
jgi:branched-chain amino acid transport system substrate-binding protein